MDPKDQRILSLSMKIEELERDRKDLIRHIKYCSDLILKSYERDAECPYCKQKHWEMHEHSCF